MLKQHKIKRLKVESIHLGGVVKLLLIGIERNIRVKSGHKFSLKLKT